MPDVRRPRVKAGRNARLRTRVWLTARRHRQPLFETDRRRAAERAAIEDRFTHALEVRAALVFAPPGPELERTLAARGGAAPLLVSRRTLEQAARRDQRRARAGAGRNVGLGFVRPLALTAATRTREGDRRGKEPLPGEVYSAQGRFSMTDRSSLPERSFCCHSAPASRAYCHREAPVSPVSLVAGRLTCRS
jgi:hypothetical protein